MMMNNDIADLKLAIRNKQMQEGQNDQSSFDNTTKKDRNTNYQPESSDGGTRNTQTNYETERSYYQDLLDESLWPEIVKFYEKTIFNVIVRCIDRNIVEIEIYIVPLSVSSGRHKHKKLYGIDFFEFLEQSVGKQFQLMNLL